MKGIAIAGGDLRHRPRYAAQPWLPCNRYKQGDTRRQRGDHQPIDDVRSPDHIARTADPGGRRTGLRKRLQPLEQRPPNETSGDGPADKSKKRSDFERDQHDFNRCCKGNVRAGGDGLA